jgi:hypothetical protein
MPARCLRPYQACSCSKTLGYFNFEWFDELTKQGAYWVSRVRSNASWTVEHILVQKDGYGEALIFLGAYRNDQTA